DAGRRGEPERARILLGPEAADRPPVDEFVQSGLNRAARYPEPPGAFQHPDPGVLGQQPDQLGIQRVPAAKPRQSDQLSTGLPGRSVQPDQRSSDPLHNPERRRMLPLRAPSVRRYPRRATVGSTSEVAMTQLIDTPDDQVDIDKLVGAVPHDISKDPFPVLGMDHIRFMVGNARQAAHYYST